MDIWRLSLNFLLDRNKFNILGDTVGIKRYNSKMSTEISKNLLETHVFQSQIFLKIFFCLRVWFHPEIFLHYYTMILQRIRVIVGDVGFEPGTFDPEVWCATNEPPHLQKSHHICGLGLVPAYTT